MKTYSVLVRCRPVLETVSPSLNGVAEISQCLMQSTLAFSSQNMFSETSSVVRVLRLSSMANMEACPLRSRSLMNRAEQGADEDQVVSWAMGHLVAIDAVIAGAD